MFRKTEKKTLKESPKVNSQGVVADSTSDDSVSSEGDVEKFGSCSKLMKLIKINEDRFKMFEFDSRVGLNGH